MNTEINAYEEGEFDWVWYGHNAVNPYKINTLKSEQWWAGFQAAMHKELYEHE